MEHGSGFARATYQARKSRLLNSTLEIRKGQEWVLLRKQKNVGGFLDLRGPEDARGMIIRFVSGFTSSTKRLLNGRDKYEKIRAKNRGWPNRNF